MTVTVYVCVCARAHSNVRYVKGVDELTLIGHLFECELITTEAVVRFWISMCDLWQCKFCFRKRNSFSHEWILIGWKCC